MRHCHAPEEWTDTLLLGNLCIPFCGIAHDSIILVLQQRDILPVACGLFSRKLVFHCLFSGQSPWLDRLTTRRNMLNLCGIYSGLLSMQSSSWMDWLAKGIW